MNMNIIPLGAAVQTFIRSNLETMQCADSRNILLPIIMELSFTPKSTSYRITILTDEEVGATDIITIYKNRINGNVYWNFIPSLDLGDEIGPFHNFAKAAESVDLYLMEYFDSVDPTNIGEPLYWDEVLCL